MKMSLKVQLLAMAGLAVVSVLVLAVVDILLLQKTSIGSSHYNRILNANELTADILPPPLYMVGPMAKIGMLDHVDSAGQKELRDGVRSDIRDYQTRIQRWRNSPDLPTELLSALDRDLDPTAQNLIRLFEAFLELKDVKDPRFDSLHNEIFAVYIMHREAVDRLVVLAGQHAQLSSKEGIETASSYKFILLTVVFISVVAVSAASYFIVRSAMRSLGVDPSELQRIALAAASGNYQIDLPESRDNSVLHAMKTMLESLREGQKIQVENTRICEALDVCDTSVMIADQDFNIIYMNKAVTEMLRAREHTLRKHLSAFALDKLMGANMDVFHKNPAHQRGMLEKLRTQYKTEIKISDLTFGLIATPILDGQGRRLGTVVEWSDKTDRLAKEAEERRVAEENARVRQALDSVTTNVMIADGDANIIYLNDAVTNMMRRAEADIRKALPHFDASNLRGKNIDIFHKNPSHQRDILKRLTTTYHGKAEVGGRIFTVIANPVTIDGQRIGTVVEWADRTAEVAIEKEVAAMVQAAGSGDFTKQINMDGKEGFFANLSKGLNELASTIEVALNDIRRMLGAMARGDLSERITRDYMGTFGQLKEDANTTADKLTEIISKIRASSGAILSAANEIAQGNADLSQRTEEQASSLEETASSMEQMTSTVKQSAENAQRANGVSQTAQRKAKEGGQVVSRAVQAMEEISASSKKISDIIGVIDEIAFQTNLLALNAAVEAARAGEQGRGFAVVAGEVRNLAQRSAGAAKEIKELIRDSVSKVQDGRQLVNASGETLSEIVAAVEQVSIMMQEIAAAAQEQTSGIEQVNTAVAQMDEMTQQNAALVEQASAAGASLADQANAMNSVVDFFSVGGRFESSYPASQPRAAHAHNSAGKNTRKNSKKSHAPRAASGSDEQWEEF